MLVFSQDSIVSLQAVFFKDSFGIVDLQVELEGDRNKEHVLGSNSSFGVGGVAVVVGLPRGYR